ncbi:MAG: hypothetical protein HPY53_05595 [Brevinematales bacterium]|nr:hypothetical protein [Brevinematales bacterium]
MNVNPIDLQVLFSKASEISGTLGRTDASKEAVQYLADVKMANDSKNTTEVVHTLNPSEEEGNKIEDNRQQKNSKQEAKERKEFCDDSAEGNDNKRAMLDGNVGKIIDIID